VKEERIIQYNALDPIIWTKNFKPDPSVLDELNLDITKPIIVFRIEESFAAYLLGRTSQESVIIPIIKNLLKQYGDRIQIVILPRYEEQISMINTIFEGSVITSEKVVDGPSLLSFTSVFIGAGGTMTAEAALLGIPAISCYPREPTIVEEFLIRERIIQRTNDPDAASLKIVSILNNFDEVRLDQIEKANNLIKNMEDPFDIIVENLEVND
jgi:predicted glycosyltransferase